MSMTVRSRLTYSELPSPLLHGILTVCLGLFMLEDLVWSFFLLLFNRKLSITYIHILCSLC